MSAASHPPEDYRRAILAMHRWLVTAVPVEGRWYLDASAIEDEDVLFAVTSMPYDEDGYPDPVIALLAADSFLLSWNGGELSTKTHPTRGDVNEPDPG